MNEVLRDRILRKLESLPDERVYQVLDYIEFMESKYAQRQAQAPNIFQRFAEGVEDTMRAGRVSTQAISETMNLMNRAMTVLSGAVAAGKSVANDVVTATARPPQSGAGAQPVQRTGTADGAAPSASPSPSSQPAPPPAAEPPRPESPPSTSSPGDIPP